MSDIVKNALRYTTENTSRSDYPDPHNGEILHLSYHSPTIGFDCSGFVCHVFLESGYRIDYESTRGLLISKAFETVPDDEVKPGNVLLFDGHVGIVITYDFSSKRGSFIHMSGSRQKGGGLKISSFLIGSGTSADKTTVGGKPPYYGTTMPVIAVRRINSNRYSSELDLHRNDSNPLPTLRPMGTRVYSNYLRNKRKPPQTKVAKDVKKKPAQRTVKLKSKPPKDPMVVAVERVSTVVTSYRKRLEHWNGDLRAKIRFPHLRY